MPFHKRPHPPHIGLLGAQAIVLAMNTLTDLIQQPCGAQHRGAASFMAEFGTVFLYDIHTVKLGYKRLAAFFPCRFRPQAPDWPVARCGLHYVRRYS